MVHKKYTYKDGKKFGPYYYETKRVDGKIITTYLGTENPHINSSPTKIYRVLISAFSIILILLTLYLFTSYNSTGHASLDIKTEYLFGEPIQGEFSLNLRKGEFIPADSEVIVTYYNQSEKFVLSSITSLEQKVGDFYAENSSIYGNGLGYGSIGLFRENPELNFKLKIIRDIEDSDTDVSLDTSTFENETNSSIILNESNQTIGENSSNSSVVSTESSSVSEMPSESVEEVTDSEFPNNLEEPEILEQPQISQESGESVDEDSQENSVITGAVVQEDFEIAGTVSKDKEYTYEIKDGDKVEIVSSSVNHDGEILADSTVSLRFENGVAIVSTEYYIETEGYGEEFLGDYAESIDIDFSQFGFLANVDAPIYVELVYNNEPIVLAYEDITVSEKTVENVSIVQESVLEIQEDQVNVNLTQFNAVVGQPVKWVKTVSVDVANPKELFIQIPESARHCN